MHRKIILSLLIGFSLVFSCANAQIPDLIPQKEEPIKKITTPPDPSALSDDWWDYFDKDEDEYNVRKDKFIKTLINFEKNVDPKTDRRLKPLINSIVEKINILSDYKKQKILTPFESQPIKNSFSLNEYINLIKSLYEKKHVLSNDKFQLNVEEKSIKDNESKYNLFFQNYKKQEKSNLKKLILGLQVISSKISIEIDKQQIALSKSLSTQKSNEIDYLKKQLDFAKNNLSITREDFDQKSAEIEALNANIKNIQNDLVSLYQQQNLAEYENRLTDIEMSILSEEILNLSIKKALLDSKIIILEIEKKIASLQLLKEKEKAANLYSNISNWTDRIRDITSNYSDWKKQAGAHFEKSIRYIEKNQKTAALLKEYENLSKTALLDLNKLEENIFVNNYLIEHFTILTKEKYTTYKDIAHGWWTSLVLFYKKYITWIHKDLFKIGKNTITLFGILKFIIIFFVGYFFAKISRFSIRKFGKSHQKVSPAAVYTLSRLSFYVILFIGIIFAVLSLGVDFTAFAVIGGILAVGIGFGLQSLFHNFIGGIILLLEKNIRVGDFIELESGEYGTVKSINVRTTLLRTLDNLEILIPNSDLVSKKFTNWTLSEKIRRVRIPFGVAYGTDKEFLKKIIINAAKKIPTTIQDREPDVWLMNFGESSLDFELVVWVNEYMGGIPVMATKSRYLWAIETALKENNISIPYPQRDIHFYEGKNEKI
ncbi:MAG: mechanosensitive ion channel [Bacteroidales bacterium]|nr:mechanosensitive ion channel [Bacteroidales bacterium]